MSRQSVQGMIRFVDGYCGIPAMRPALLIKISFWLVVIGGIALVTPNPAWPEWLSRMVLSSGIALAITTLGVQWWKNRRGGGPGK